MLPKTRIRNEEIRPRRGRGHRRAAGRRHRGAHGAAGQDRRDRQTRSQRVAAGPSRLRETGHQPAAPPAPCVAGDPGADARGRREVRGRHDRGRRAHLGGRRSLFALRRRGIRGDQDHPRLARAPRPQTGRRRRKLGCHETRGGDSRRGGAGGGRTFGVPAAHPRLPHLRRLHPLRGRFLAHAFFHRAPVAAAAGRHVGRQDRPRAEARRLAHPFRLGWRAAAERCRSRGRGHHRRRSGEQPIYLHRQYVPSERHRPVARRLGPAQGERRRGHGRFGRMRQSSVQGRAFAHPGVLYQGVPQPRLRASFRWPCGPRANWPVRSFPPSA